MISVARFNAFIFDFDGVLVDSEVLQARAWSRLAGELRLGTTVQVHQIAGKLDRHIAPELFAGQDVNWCVTRKQVLEQELEEASGIPYIDASLDLARRLSTTHRLAICSSSSASRIRRMLDSRGVLPLFSAIVGQEPGEACKPSPEPYRKALRLLDVHAEQACALEDSLTGTTAAKAAGLYVIQLLHDGLPESPLADAIVRSAAEIQ